MTPKLLRNLRSALREPRHLVNFAIYTGKRLFGGANGATVRLPWGHDLAGFVNYSEYLSAPTALTRAEVKFFEALMLLILKRNESPTIFDVGANIGLVTMYLSALAKAGRIYSFEPSNSTFESLTSNLAINNIINVTAEKSVISDVVGQVQFDATPGGRANAHIAYSRSVAGSLLRSETLDNYCRERGIVSIDLLKVDTEGFEAAVFRGARQLLISKNISAIYFEFCPVLEERAGQRVGDAVRYLLDLEYNVFRISDEGRLIDFSTSYALLPSICNIVATKRDAGLDLIHAVHAHTKAT